MMPTMQKICCPELGTQLCRPAVLFILSQRFKQIYLSTAEAEYIALSQALREVIPLMSLMEEINTTFPILLGAPESICTVHEDNQSCINMSQADKLSPRTKHIALKYHQFSSFVKSKSVTIKYCRTKMQKADILTKPLSDALFFRLRHMLIGW